MPAMFGEAPRGKNGRDPIMDGFANATYYECLKNNITYFDIRSYMFEHLPKANWSGWKHDDGIQSGYWTQKDGEHFNDRGQQLVVDVYTSYLDEWYPFGFNSADDDHLLGGDDTLID